MNNAKFVLDHQSIKLPDLAFGKEWALLELLTLGLDSSVERERFANLINSPDLNWQELLTQATRHKITNLLSAAIIANHLSEVVPLNIRQQLINVRLFNQHKIQIYRREAAKIVEAFTRKELKFVGTKGISVESTLYQGNGSRTMSDIDFMILPQEREPAIQALSQLGYQMGTYEQKTNKIRPHSREMMIKYKLNPDHLPSHVLLTNDVVTPFVEVDIANSLTWTSCPWQIPVEIALENILVQSIPEIKNIKLPVFSAQFQFIFTILHLFKEAWIEMTLEMDGKDVNLSKFSDVIRLWRSHHHELDVREFVGILEEFSLTQPVLWVLEHLDRTFNLDIVKSLGLQNQVTESWLHSASDSRQWQGTMRNRLYSLNRDRLFIKSARCERDLSS